ncbi:MAG: ATP-binding cassette domain-containing protein [Treponema sp.]|nr:ATP-binding cassette domain-containing protein [Treponema sp.]
MDLNLYGISVHFTLKKVLTNLTVTFKECQIHAVLGENGAGKSTLAKVISGELAPGKGQIFVNNDEVFFSDAKTAIQNGICHVHQRQLLAESISVKENLLLGVHKPDKKYFDDLCSCWLKDVPLNKKLKDTSGDQRFFVALTGALLKNPKILILDEPSALLDLEQRTFLFTELQKLSQSGLNIIVITHDIKEALAYCDTITLLKDGEVLRTFEKNQADENEITKLLFGQEKTYGKYDTENTSTSKVMSTEKKSTSDVPAAAPKSARPAAATDSKSVQKNLTLTIENLTAKPLNRPSLFNINFSANSGQITLIQGLAESGLGTLEQILTGIDSSHTKGTLTLTDEQSTNAGIDSTTKTSSTAADEFSRHQHTLFTCNLKTGRFNTRTLRKKMGIRVGIIPTDRTFTGSNPALIIEEILCKSYDSDSRNSNTTISEKELISAAEIEITTKEKAANLSGGMLQRLIFTRETNPAPDLLVLCEPLQGLDKFACETLFTKLSNFAKKGMMIIVLSSTPFPDALCKKIYKLDSGYLYAQTKTSEKEAM